MHGDDVSGALPRRRLGRTALELTELGLGTASLGNLYAPMDDATAREVVAAAWQAGIRFFDTAPYYGFGLSERRLGDALRARLGETFSVSTKVGRLLKPLFGHRGSGERHGFHSPMPFAPVYDYTYDGIMRSLAESRQRLGLARIDILLVHDIGTLTHKDANARHLDDLRRSGYRALENLRAAGEVKAIGLGVNEWRACSDALDWGEFDCFLLAGRYTLLEQEPLETLFPKCARAGVTLIIGGVFNSGILATGTRGAERPHYNYEPASDAVLDRVRRIERICEAHGVALPAAALQFPLAHPQVTTVIPGAASPDEVRSAVQHYRTAIPAAFWSDLKTEGLLAQDAPVPGET